MSGELTTCQRCAGSVTADDRFCENCGSDLTAPAVVSVPRRTAVEGPCVDCGNASFTDGYCTVCGNMRTAPDRDEAEIDGVVLITDRGITHSRNEDSAAAGTAATMTSPSIAISVCDGVSTSSAAHAASGAASSAGVDAMLAALGACAAGPAAVLAGMSSAAVAAAETAGTDCPVAPSCTYTGAVVVRATDGSIQISVGNVGDSRAYWFPEPPGQPEQLTVDDSVAQELMSAGAQAGSEAVLAGAHVLTRWLGADADQTPWTETSIRTITAREPGVLLLCSDGLWNYLPNAADIALFFSRGDPHAAARALVDHALAAGGHDNVTVAVVPIGGLHESR